MPPNKAQADKVSREFEAMFLGQMLNHMFSGLKTDGVFGGGEGGEDVTLDAGRGVGQKAVTARRDRHRRLRQARDRQMQEHKS